MRSNAGLQVSGIDHVVLHVADLERAHRFYTELLGFEIAHEFPGHSFLRCGTQIVGLFEHAGDLHARDEMNHLALRLTDGDSNTPRRSFTRQVSRGAADLALTAASTSLTP